MLNSEYARMRRLNRRASDYGWRVRKARNAGFYFWNDRYGIAKNCYGFDNSLDDIEEILDDWDAANNDEN